MSVEIARIIRAMVPIRFLIVIVLLLPVRGWASRETPRSVKDLTFLTRDGCVNTPDMVNNLEDALTALKLPHDYAYINIGTLAKDDPRTGYPTPTVLWKSKDIFGMPTPIPPYPEPS
jgi:hypothetical protein